MQLIYPNRLYIIRLLDSKIDFHIIPTPKAVPYITRETSSISNQLSSSYNGCLSFKRYVRKSLQRFAKPWALFNATCLQSISFANIYIWWRWFPSTLRHRIAYIVVSQAKYTHMIYLWKPKWIDLQNCQSEMRVHLSQTLCGKWIEPDLWISVRT